MKLTKRLSLAALVLVLVGQGCLSGDPSAAPDGSVWITDDLGKSWLQLEALPQTSTVSTISSVNVNDIEIDPSDNSTLYLGTKTNGMFYSIDSGQTWRRPENGDVRSGHVGAIEVHPESVCTTWVLKHKSILKSSDCTRTYEEVYTEGRSSHFLNHLVLDWFDHDVLYASTTAGDVIKSVDGGTSWQSILSAGDGVRALTVSNTDSRIVLVGTSRRGSFWRSTDAGETWEEYEDIVTGISNNNDEQYGFAQTRDGTTLVMNTEVGLVRSFDAGENWEDVPTIANPKTGELIHSVAMDPNDGNVMYYGIQGTLYSTNDGGELWTAEDMPSARAPSDMLVHPSQTEVVLVGFAVVEE